MSYRSKVTGTKDPVPVKSSQSGSEFVKLNFSDSIPKSMSTSSEKSSVLSSDDPWFKNGVDNSCQYWKPDTEREKEIFHKAWREHTQEMRSMKF